MRVFLSSTYEDLIEYRAKAANAVERLGQHGVRMEVFGARPTSASSACFEEIDSCDALVGIYAHRYGYIPDGSNVSITEQEFDFALEKHKPVFGFLVDANYPWLPIHIDHEPALSRLNLFKQKIQETVVRDVFTTPDDLAYKVASSLGRFLLGKKIKEELDQITGRGVVTSEEGRDQVARRAARLQVILQGARVLLVNDVPSDMSGVIRILANLGAVVDVATTSDEGLLALAGSRFDLVISDMMRNDVPDEGIRFLAQMRSRNLYRPTIFTVGRFKPELGTPAYAFGITNRVDELLNLVFDALERTRG
jgi:CheY-like chemotaxis protein